MKKLRTLLATIALVSTTSLSACVTPEERDDAEDVIIEQEDTAEDTAEEDNEDDN